MLYRDETAPRIERRLELFLGPVLVFLVAAIICAVMISRSTGF